MKHISISLGLVSLLPLQMATAKKNVQQEKPNILFLISDDHSVPFLGCYGTTDIKTPNFDKFAAESMVFNRAYVTAPQSAPSRSSFYTGRSPVSTTMSMFSLPLPADAVTYADICKKNGYFTGVTARSDHQDGLGRNKEIKDAIEKFGLKTFAKRFDYAKSNGMPYPEFVSVIDSAQKSKKPFCVQVSFYDPHRPWDKNAIPEPHNPKTIKLPPHYPDNDLIREDFARHYDEIARMDTEFGKMMADLEKRGLKENTIVVFVGDNGTAMLRGKGTLYEYGINVPLIVRWPNKIKPAYSSQLISGEDFAPTLLELAGLKPDPRMTGVSFAPQLLGKEGKKRDYVFSERAAHAEDLPVTTKDFDLVRCVITSKYKLIYNATRELAYWPVDFSHEPFWIKMVEENRRGIIDPEVKRLFFSQRQMFELYDLENDPQELTNLIGKTQYIEIEKDLRKQLGDKMLLDRDYVPLPYYSLDAEYK